MQCNIDARGKAIRLIVGLLHLLAAAALAVVLLSGLLLSGWWWFLVIAVAGGGAFMVFEGWAGWCVVRAMGFRTPW